MKLPCVNCITLAICKSIAMEVDGTKVNDVIVAGHRLAHKCKPIDDFLVPDPETKVTRHIDMGQLQIALTYLMEGIEKC